MSLWPVLFNSRVLSSCLMSFFSHKAGRCRAQQRYAYCYWYFTCNFVAMSVNNLQYNTAPYLPWGASIMLQATIHENRDLPLYSDLFNHPPVLLSSTHPLWYAITGHDIGICLGNEWSAMIVNHSVITDPSICPSSFTYQNTCGHPWIVFEQDRLWCGQPYQVGFL